MKLLSLEVENFRQFRGKQKLEFATEPDKNVTLVYGANGGGKTTLLNAFTWVLYGSLTDDLERPEELIHSDTWALANMGSRLAARGVLIFDHQGSRFEVERVVAATKDSPEQVVKDTKGQVRILIMDDRGETFEPKNPVDRVDRILPEKLSRFFFFNGERIENLTRHAAYEELSEATRTLLGLEVVTRAIHHLPRAAKSFQVELGRLGDTEGLELNRLIEGLESALTSNESDTLTAERNVEALQDQRDLVWAELQRNAESRVLQERRETAVKARVKADELLDRLLGSKQSVLSQSGCLPFVTRIVSVASEKFRDLERNGELPAPVKEPFVRDLLDRGSCVCGAPLHPGSPSRRQLEEFLKTAGSPELEGLWTKLSGSAERLPKAAVAFNAELVRLQREEDEALRSRVEAIEAESEVSRKLKGSESVDVEGLESRHQRIDRDHRTTVEEIGRLKSGAVHLRKQIEENKKELLKVASNDERSQHLKRCHQVATEAVGALEDIQSVLTEGIRQQLNRRIAATYANISARPRVPELTSDFELRLMEEGPDGVARAASNSTSENSILALSFVGGLVSLARDLSQDRLDDDALRRLTEGAGGVFPVVMDAPFGPLDKVYKKEVARALPALAAQLVVFVSQTQAQDTVEELLPHLGRRAVIVSHVAKEGQDEDVMVDGQAFPYRRVCEPGEQRTEIVTI